MQHAVDARCVPDASPWRSVSSPGGCARGIARADRVSHDPRSCLSVQGMHHAASWQIGGDLRNACEPAGGNPAYEGLARRISGAHRSPNEMRIGVMNSSAGIALAATQTVRIVLDGILSTAPRCPMDPCTPPLARIGP